MTRGDQLAENIAFALVRAVKVIRGLRIGLKDHERHEVAQAAVSELKKHGDPWRLTEEVPAPPLAPATEWMPTEE